MKSDKRYRVPNIDWSRTSRQVLTMERIKGTPLKDARKVKGKSWKPEDIGKTIVQVFLTQAMRDGFFHADLHQGNFFVEDDGTLVAVDFGIMGRLDKDSRRYLAEILFGFHTRNFERVAEVHFEAGYVPEDQDKALFAQAMRALVEPILDKPLNQVSLSEMLSGLFKTTEQFQMKTQPQLIMLQRSMVMVEGLALSLNKDVNMWEISRPVLEKWARKLTGQSDILSDLLDFIRKLFALFPDLIAKLREFLRTFADSPAKTAKEPA